MYHVDDKGVLFTDTLILKCLTQPLVVKDTFVVVEEDTVPRSRVVQAVCARDYPENLSCCYLIRDIHVDEVASIRLRRAVHLQVEYEHPEPSP